MKFKIFTFALSVFLIGCINTAICQANTTLSNLVSPTAISQDLLPNGNNTRNLGSASKSWRIIYLDSSIYLKDVLFLQNKGIQNAFVGQSAGIAISTGNNNAAFGYHALFAAKSNSYNSAFGSLALAKSVAGSNSAFGANALGSNSTATGNAAVGTSALYKNTTGGSNTAVGYQALYSNTTAGSNTAVGYQALYSNTTGSPNTAFGWGSLYSNTTGNENAAFGEGALFYNTTGIDNTAFGQRALYQNVDAGFNTAIGFKSLFANFSGIENTAVGTYALINNRTGSSNTGIGYQTLYNCVTGEYNAAIGFYSDVSQDGLSNATALGNYTTVDASNKVRIGGTFITSIGGQVGWTTFSDGRYKKNIKQDVQGLSFINNLQPITYTVDIDGLDEYYDKGRKKDSIFQKMKADIKASSAKAAAVVYNGFIAQDVEKAATKLNYKFSGVDKPQTESGLYGLRYADFVVPLVKAVQELSTQNDTLREQNAALIANQASLETRLAKLEALMVNSSSADVSLSNASLYQNTPNPFKGNTVISYNVPQRFTTAQLVVYNVQGMALKQVNIPAQGKGTIKVDAATLASGAYSYSLIVDGKLIDSKKMLVIK